MSAHLPRSTAVTGGPTRDMMRSELVYFETPNGGAVFSVGSISSCGSLPHNGFDNNISRMVDNVLRRFRSSGFGVRTPRYALLARDGLSCALRFDGVGRPASP